MGRAEESDFQKKCQNLFLPWQNYTVFHQLLGAAQFPESGALLFFQSLRPEHLLPRDASIFSHPRGKQLTDFLWLQEFPVTVVSDVCWALFVCLERDAEEGHREPLEVGSFATDFK